MNSFLVPSQFKKKLNVISSNISNKTPEILIGHITRVTGMRLEAKGLSVPMGTICQIELMVNNYIYGEVIGFDDDVVYIMPMDAVHGIKHGANVIPLATSNQVPVGTGMLGRVVDASGTPIDKHGIIEYDQYYPIMGHSRNPLERDRITEPLDVGVRAINGLVTVGKGQRIGIFAGSGVGKSVLLGMMTRYTQADIVVVGLVGERGREVREFIEESIGEEGLKKTVVVASPADTSPLMRANSALLATTVAEYFCDKGLDVLLIVDSLTRYAHAIREISLSAGEMPTTKGYTPTVFAKLSQLIERSGIGKNGIGSITAFYTVLVEGDESQDPIADHVRSVLDGHIVLSRELADSGLYPAIDIEKSISRIMPQITSKSHRDASIHFKQLYSSYNRNKEIINMGMYQAGSDKTVDEAIKNKQKMMHYLQQDINQATDFNEAFVELTSFYSQPVTNEEV